MAYEITPLDMEVRQKQFERQIERWELHAEATRNQSSTAQDRHTDHVSWADRLADLIRKPHATG